MSKRYEQAFDHDLRIEKVVDFASMAAHLGDLSRLPEQIEEVIDDSFGDNHLHPSMKGFMGALDAGDDESDASLLEKLQDIPRSMVDTIFIQGATPLRSYHSKNGWSSGWGMYYTKWVAAKTFDAGWKLLIAWADERHEKDRAEASA